MNTDSKVELESTGEGILLPVQAQPRARKNAVRGIQDGRLKVAVTQAPEKGKANAALLKVLAAALGLRRSQLQLVGGATGRQKYLLVAGVEPNELQRRISACLDASSDN